MTKNNEKKNFNEKTRDEENIENNLDKASNKASSFVENYNKINDNLSSKNEQDPNEDDKQILEEISSVMKEGIYINPIETSDDHIEEKEKKELRKDYLCTQNGSAWSITCAWHFYWKWTWSLVLQCQP